MHRSRRRGSGRSLVISNFLNLLDIKIYQKYASYLPGKLRYPSTHTFNKQITRLREVSFCLPYPEKNFTNI